jgi:hypothetical protein
MIAVPLIVVLIVGLADLKTFLNFLNLAENSSIFISTIIAVSIGLVFKI